MKIEFATGLSLPADAATQTFGIIARKGAGKSYAAGKLVEGFAKTETQFVVMTPLPNWWGLRLAADGKSPGLDIPLLGGLRGDIPLNPESGKLIADAVVDTGRSFVLDVSQFSLSARKRFATAFGEQLWQRQKALEDPRPIHVVLEEAQLFLPQQTFKGDEHMVGIWTEIVRLGRNCGIGVTMISQRPQSVSKEALTQVECLIVLQVNGVQEKKALREWIVEKGADTDLLEELPFLPQGVAYIWSPQWLQHFGKHEIRPKWTYDSGATPKVGAKRQKAKLKPIDLDALKTAMAETVKKAEENDPAALKKRIRELEAETKTAPHKIETKETLVFKERDHKAISDGMRKAIELCERFEKTAEGLAKEFALLSGKMHQTAGQQWKAGPIQPKAWTKHMPAPEQHGVQHIFTLPKGTHPPREHVLRNSIAKQETMNGHGGKGELKILQAIAQYDGGIPRETISVLTGYKASSRNTYLQRLKQQGLVVEANDSFQATPQGISELGSSFIPLPTGDALREHWLNKLPEGERKILATVLDAYPRAIAREAIDEATGYKSSSRNTYLQRLSARQLVYGRDEVKASDVLFS